MRLIQFQFSALILPPVTATDAGLEPDCSVLHLRLAGLWLALVNRANPKASADKVFTETERKILNHVAGELQQPAAMSVAHYVIAVANSVATSFARPTDRGKHRYAAGANAIDRNSPGRGNRERFG